METLEAYRKLLQRYPLRTKAITSMCVSAAGQLVGSALRAHRSKVPQGALSSHSPNNEFRKLLVFTTYGLIVGPFFHWWYATLEKMTVRVKENRRMAYKLLLDRLVCTPPFLLATLLYLTFLSTLNTAQTLKSVANTYWPALKRNWQVWTIAQLINFKYVPLEYRVLFGNLVALWWNVYLSLTN